MATNKINSIQLPPTEDWHYVGAPGEPAFQNGWVNYDTLNVQAAFCKDIYGVVHLQGLVKSGTVATVIFTLPVGYRPKESTHHIMAGSQGDPMTSMHVYSSGEVDHRTGTNAYNDLTGITFRADN